MVAGLGLARRVPSRVRPFALAKISRDKLFSTSNSLHPPLEHTTQLQNTNLLQASFVMAHIAKKRKLSTGENDPVIAAEETTAAPEKSFRDLGIRQELCDACESLGFTAPRPIQVESIPYALDGRDVIGLAETGSGKTAAFALPILQGNSKP